MKVLVTGGSGYVGEGVVDYLANNYEIGVFDKWQNTQRDVEFVEGDILDFDAASRAMEGVDAVVHLAAVPGPSPGPRTVININSMGTISLLEAAHTAGVGKFVYISSESIYGLSFGKGYIRPQYLPMDEEHPIVCRDCYSLSKLYGEQACETFSRHGMKTVALRLSFVAPGRSPQFMYSMNTNPEARSRNLWAYLHREDVAQAVKLSLEVELESGFEAFNISAADHASSRPAEELRAEYFPEVPTRGREVTGFSSFMSIDKARRMLGYEPRHALRRIGGGQPGGIMSQK